MREILTIENPAIAGEWCYEKNGDLRPEDFTGGSGKKVWWRCVEGHTWFAQINKRYSSGRGCPYCSGNKVWLGYNDIITTHPKVADEWDYDKNGGLRPEQFSIGSDVKAWWKCKCGHSWLANINSRKKCGCPACARNILVGGVNDLLTCNPTLAAEWDGVKNGGIRPVSIAVNSNRKMWWLCTQGHSWQAAVCSRNAGRGCPYCNRRTILAGFNDLLTEAPGFVAEWDYEKNGSLRPEMVFSASHKPVWWICKNGHSWYAQIAGRRNGNGCPYCAGKLAVSGKNDLRTLRPDLAKEWNCEKNGSRRPENVTTQSHLNVWWKCHRGHEYKALVSSRFRGNGCPFCSGKRPIPGETDFASLHPELLPEWDYEKNGNLRPEDFTVGSHKKTWWRCDKGHSWQTAIYHRHGGKGCRRCGALVDPHRIIVGVTDLATVDPVIASEWDDERNEGLTAKDVLPNSNRIVWWKCKRGHHWRTQVQTRMNGSGCPYCRGKTPMRTRLI